MSLAAFPGARKSRTHPDLQDASASCTGGKAAGLLLSFSSLRRPSSPAWAAAPWHTLLQAVRAYIFPASGPPSATELPGQAAARGAARGSKGATRLGWGWKWGWYSDVLDLICCALLTYSPAHRGPGQWEV